MRLLQHAPLYTCPHAYDHHRKHDTSVSINEVTTTSLQERGDTDGGYRGPWNVGRGNPPPVSSSFQNAGGIVPYNAGTRWAA